MQIRDALSILNLHQQPITLDDIKKSYRRAAAKYHPDHNPAGLEMMQLINAAYDTLKQAYADNKLNHEDHHTGDIPDYGEAFNIALNAIRGLGLDIEICGAWIWVSGDTRPHKEALKSAHFLWSPHKQSWYFRPEQYRSRNRQSWKMEKIRSVYGSRATEEEVARRGVTA
jgi:curved DNA-binding protein CbpA